MNAYYYRSKDPIESILGCTIIDSGELKKDTLEGVNGLTTSNFDHIILHGLCPGDYLYIIHKGTYTQFVCDW